MAPGTPSNGLENTARWFPPVLAIIVGTWVAYRTRLDPSLGIRHITLLIGVSLWLIAALAIAIGPGTESYRAAYSAPEGQGCSQEVSFC